MPCIPHHSSQAISVDASSAPRPHPPFTPSLGPSLSPSHGTRTLTLLWPCPPGLCPPLPLLPSRASVSSPTGALSASPTACPLLTPFSWSSGPCACCFLGSELPCLPCELLSFHRTLKFFSPQNSSYSHKSPSWWARERQPLLCAVTLGSLAPLLHSAHSWSVQPLPRPLVSHLTVSIMAFLPISGSRFLLHQQMTTAAYFIFKSDIK